MYRMFVNAGEFWIRWTALTVVLVGMCLTGCRHGSDAPPAKPKTDATAAKEPKAAEKKAQPQVSAVTFLRALRDNLAAGRGKEVAAAVPPSYQEAIALWGTHWLAIDREARNHFLQSLAQAAETVAQKDQLIGGSSRLVFNGPWAGLLNTHLAGLARATASLARWPGWLTGEDESFDVSGLIAAVAKAIANEPELRDAIKRMEFQAMTGESERVSVRYRSSPSEPWRTIALKQVETAWVPTTLDKALTNAAATKRENDPGNSRNFGQQLQRVASQLDQFTSALGGISTQSEFDQLVQQTARGYLAKTPVKDASEVAPRPLEAEEFVQIVVSGELSALQKDQLLWQLTQHTDAPASAIATMRKAEEADSVVIRLGPVADIPTFAQSLPGLTIEKIDEKKRTIKARVTP